ncbi:uncharacterized protein LOC129001255 [Macrosteles quadrilineatus]|uniref:uncharacterized protein LOC129001255 n=1 Tax=Macrosteles quadrilineatus TaxID=74068 RepID=UPI0023E0C5D0|nr:uncharacterized protein LOC129001255 [Macrosteles quadrilineatus]
MFASRVATLVVCFILTYTTIQGDYNQESDFLEVVKKDSFVDKSAFIKDFLEGTDCNVVLRGPHRSGKSTAIDMIRRFVEIQPDDQGRPLSPNTTENYMAFQKHNLEIFKHQDVVEKHFGRYPVILFDFQPLSKIVSHYDVLEIFKKWLREAHTKHRYLLHERNIWIGKHEKSHFEELMEKSNIKYGPSYMIQKFTRLCELLYIHFQKPIFALVDDYDAFLDSPDISFNFSNDYVVSFIQNFSAEFFQKNRFLGNVFVTGLHRVRRSPCPDFKFNFPAKTVFHNYTDKHPLCQLLGSY